MDINQQLTHGVYFTLLLVDDIPASVCRFVIFDNRKTVFCSRSVYTKEEFRQSGYATKVLIEGFKFLKDNYNCKKLISYISKDNLASIKLHIKAGYHKQTKYIKYYIENRFSFDDSEIYEKS